jgi:hypothetical protein
MTTLQFAEQTGRIQNQGGKLKIKQKRRKKVPDFLLSYQYEFDSAVQKFDQTVSEKDIAEMQSLVVVPACVEDLMNALKVIFDQKPGNWLRTKPLLLGLTKHSFLTLDLFNFSEEKTKLLQSYADTARPDVLLERSTAGSVLAEVVHAILHFAQKLNGLPLKRL